jgi:DNA-binding transcriptional regulator YiaG
MHGRKDQKNANESGNTISGELDEQALTRELKRFVEESELSIPKIASEMGVFSATLSMWIGGTTKPSRAATEVFREQSSGVARKCS